MTVLDTAFLIDVMQGEEEAARKIVELVESYDATTVSAITLTELHHGIARSDRPTDEADLVRETLASVPTYPLRGEIAARAGEIDGRLAAEGTPIALPDVLIAATAMHHDEPVLTRNVEDFERIEDLEVATY